MAKNRIKELRKSKDITLTSLSEMLAQKGIKVNASQLSKFEKGINSPRKDDIWDVLSEIFDVNVSYLLGVSDHKVINNNELKDKIRDDDNFVDEIRGMKSELYLEAIHFLSNSNLNKVNKNRKLYISRLIAYTVELENKSDELSEEEYKEIEETIHKVFSYMRNEIDELNKKRFRRLS